MDLIKRLVASRDKILPVYIVGPVSGYQKGAEPLHVILKYKEGGVRSDGTIYRCIGIGQSAETQDVATVTRDGMVYNLKSDLIGSVDLQERQILDRNGNQVAFIVKDSGFILGQRQPLAGYVGRGVEEHGVYLPKPKYVRSVGAAALVLLLGRALGYRLY